MFTQTFWLVSILTPDPLRQDLDQQISHISWSSQTKLLMLFTIIFTAGFCRCEVRHKSNTLLCVHELGDCYTKCPISDKQIFPESCSGTSECVSCNFSLPLDQFTALSLFFQIWWRILMKHPRMRPTRRNGRCQNMTGPRGAQNVKSVWKGGKL